MECDDTNQKKEGIVFFIFKLLAFPSTLLSQQNKEAKGIYQTGERNQSIKFHRILFCYCWKTSIHSWYLYFDN